MLPKLSSAFLMRREDQTDASDASFTDEHHIMSRDELEYQPSAEEHDLVEKVIEELRKRMVFGEGSTSFGLKWQAGTVNDPELLLGGWLSQVSRSRLGSGPVNGPMRFCILDDDAKAFKQCLDEHAKTRRAVNYDDIVAVRPRLHQKSWYLEVYNKESKWEFMPIDPTDRETLWRWAAALQFRSGTYDSSLSRQVTMALKAATWTQSVYRMYKAKQRVARKREKKSALLNRLAAAVGYDGWNNDDSDDEDEDEGGITQYAYDVGTSVVNMAWSAMGSWLGLGGSPPLLEADEDAAAAEQQQPEKSEESGGPLVGVPNRGRPKTRDSNFVQFSHELPQLGLGEVEDEVWENQRWAVSSWNTVGLGVTERAPFSDRLGRGKFEDPRKPNGGIPVPKGWKVVGEYTVDASGRTKGRCDKDGWMFSSSFQLMDSDLAKGIFVGHNPGGLQGFVVRRRRWVRRRVHDLSQSSSLLETTEPILLMGWLGAKTNTTGRWTSRMYVLTRPGLRIGTIHEDLTAAILSKPTGPALTCFRFNFRGVDDVVLDGGVDATKWKNLTEAEAKTIQLDPRHCRLDESIATSARPGYFALIVDGKPKVFNANDSTAREAWVAVISNALKEASRVRRPRTLRLVGGAFETASYLTIIMDSMLLVRVDDVEEACFTSPSVQAAIVVRQGLKNPKTGTWNGNERVIEYDSPTDGHVVEHHVRARSEKGVGYIVDRLVSSPHAQFGEEFQLKMRFILVSAEFEKNKNCCRVIVSIDVELLKHTMMVGFIQSNSRRNAAGYISDVWLPAVLGYLEGKGLVPPANKVASKPSVFGKQGSGKISVLAGKAASPSIAGKRG